MHEKKKQPQESSVVFDNMFHRNLSGVRNQGVQQNHPDINRMIAEHQHTTQGALNHSTLYSMPSATRTELEKDNHEKSISQDELVPALYNFRHALKLFEKETKRAKKYKRPVTLAIIGFSDLPSVYTKYGVLAQEESIRFVGNSIANLVDPDIDIAGRYESYRFLVILPENKPDMAVKVFEAMRIHFESNPIQYHQYKFALTASIGIVSIPHHGYEWKELIAKADLACDMVIEQGGNALGSC